MSKNQGPIHPVGWWHMPLAALILAAIILVIGGERLAALVTAIASLVLWAVALLE